MDNGTTDFKKMLKRIAFDRRIAAIVLIASISYQIMDWSMPFGTLASLIGFWAFLVLIFG